MHPLLLLHLSTELAVLNDVLRHLLLQCRLVLQHQRHRRSRIAGWNRIAGRNRIPAAFHLPQFYDASPTSSQPSSSRRFSVFADSPCFCSNSFSIVICVSRDPFPYRVQFSAQISHLLTESLHFGERDAIIGCRRLGSLQFLL